MCRYEIAESAVQVLNILGYNGYKVVGMSQLLNRCFTISQEAGMMHNLNLKVVIQLNKIYCMPHFYSISLFSEIGE